MSNRHFSHSRLQRQGFEKARSLSSLRRCGGTQEEEEIKEQIADEMLSAVRFDPARPARSERQLSRQIQGKCVIRIDSLTDNIVSTRPPQSAVDELKFLMTLTPLTKRERFFLRGWMLGWTQAESSERWLEQFGPDGRYMVSRALKEAVEKCNSNSPVSFGAMSRQTIYRRPSRRSAAWRMAKCAYCKEPYICGFGEGVFCTTGCRDAYYRRALGGE